MSWKLGRVAGIDLYLHPTFLLLLLFVGLAPGQGGLEAVVLLAAAFGCVLLHELGHALMARQYGIDTADITLYPIGGVARLTRMPRSPGAEFLIALAGPAVNVVIALTLSALQALWGGSPLWTDSPAATLLDLLIGANWILAAFNMIPAFPMDGGRVLRALLSGWLGRLRATEVAATIGQGLALAFGVYSLMHFSWIQVALAGFIYFAAYSERAQVQADEWQRSGRERPRPGFDFFSGRFRPAAPEDREPWGHPAPAGYRWVSQGPGVWVLVPIVVPASGPRPSSSWR
jgi:Zn-dependent protease